MRKSWTTTYSTDVRQDPDEEKTELGTQLTTSSYYPALDVTTENEVNSLGSMVLIMWSTNQRMSAAWFCKGLYRTRVERELIGNRNHHHAHRVAWKHNLSGNFLLCDSMELLC